VGFDPEAGIDRNELLDPIFGRSGVELVPDADVVSHLAAAALTLFGDLTGEALGGGVEEESIERSSKVSISSSSAALISASEGEVDMAEMMD
jgi:hypothetical protein